MPPLSAPGVPPSQASTASAAATGTGATKGSSGVREPEMFSLEDAEATVETLLLMEFADLGTLDQTVTSGRLKGDMVRTHAVALQTGCFLAAEARPPGWQYDSLHADWMCSVGPCMLGHIATAGLPAHQAYWKSHCSSAWPKELLTYSA